jgi:cytidylate kinase
MTARIVTLSTTYGAGGSIIGPRLADSLGLAFADRLILPPGEGAPASPSAGAERITDEERHQHARRSFFARLAHLTGGMGMPVPGAEDLSADPVRERVEASIAALVEDGGAVILGRAAAIVLAREPRAFHVRLDGPVRRRVPRAMKIEGIDEGTARRRLEETDRARAAYVERLYGRNAADPVLYHLVLDSTVLRVGDCVDLLAATATAFWRDPVA